MKRAALFLPALALGLALTGCGGSDGSVSDSDAASEAAVPAISHDDFVEQANGICTDANADLDAAGSKLAETPTEDELVAFITDTAIPNFQGQHDAIAELGAPEGEEDDVEALLAAIQDGIDTVSDDPVAFTEPDVDPFADANAAATELGLTVCAAS